MLTHISHTVAFCKATDLGYLTSSPANIGSALRITMRIKLPHVAGVADFAAICARHNISARAVQEEGSDAANVTFELSNRVTAQQPLVLLKGMLDAVVELTALDKELAIKALDRHGHEAAKPPVRSRSRALC